MNGDGRLAPRVRFPLSLGNTGLFVIAPGKARPAGKGGEGSPAHGRSCVEAGASQLRHPNSGHPGNGGRGGRARNAAGSVCQRRALRPGSRRPLGHRPRRRAETCVREGRRESPPGRGQRLSAAVTAAPPALLPGRGRPGGRAARRLPPPPRPVLPPLPPRRAHGLSPAPPPQGRLPE